MDDSNGDSNTTQPAPPEITIASPEKSSTGRVMPGRRVQPRRVTRSSTRPVTRRGAANRVTSPRRVRENLSTDRRKEVSSPVTTIVEGNEITSPSNNRSPRKQPVTSNPSVPVDTSEARKESEDREDRKDRKESEDRNESEDHEDTPEKEKPESETRASVRVNRSPVRKAPPSRSVSRTSSRRRSSEEPVGAKKSEPKEPEGPKKEEWKSPVRPEGPEDRETQKEPEGLVKKSPQFSEPIELLLDSPAGEPGKRPRGIQEFTSPVRSTRRTPTASVNQRREEQKRRPNRYQITTKHVNDYSGCTPEEESRLWGEFEVRFNILRESNPDHEITLPDRNTETLEDAHSRYIGLIRGLQYAQFIKDVKNQYMIYFLIGWVLVDLLLSFLNLNTDSGYLKFQMRLSSRYKPYLLMLGEKQWEAEGGDKIDPLWAMLKINLVSSLAYIVMAIIAKKSSNKVILNPDSVLDLIYGNKTGEEDEFKAEIEGIDVAEAARAMSGQNNILGGLGNMLGGLFR